VQQQCKAFITFCILFNKRSLASELTVSVTGIEIGSSRLHAIVLTSIVVYPRASGGGRQKHLSPQG